MDKINIIMATYQGEMYLPQQLDSLLQSTYTDYTISIYDDGSTDHTADIIRTYLERYPDKISFTQNQKNMGHRNNFLQGVIGSSYDYVMFCDQDDVWNVDKIEKTYRCMKLAEAENHSCCPVVVFTDAAIVDETLQPLHDSFHQSGGLDTSKLDLPHMLMENKMMGCTMMLNRAVIEKVTQFPKFARFHDWWIALIAAAYGRIVYLPEATMLYRQHGNNVVGNTSFPSYVKNRLSHLKEQRSAVTENIKQAEEFYRIYQESLPLESKKKIKAFLELGQAGFFKKRYLVLKYGFLKSGFTRNIGLLLIL